MLNSLSAMDIFFLYKELQSIVGAKYVRSRRLDGQLLADLYRPGVGKIQLRIMVPNFVYVSTQENKGSGSNFTKTLDAHLRGAILKGIFQPNFERILELEFLGIKGRRFLITELFSKGNILLLREDKKIIAAFAKQHWGGRDLKAGADYLFPPQQQDVRSLSASQIIELVSVSRMSNVVKFMAKDLGLGGRWAEELCAIQGIDKEQKPAKIGTELSEKIRLGLKKISRHLLNPQIYNKEGTWLAAPFKLESLADWNCISAQSFSKAIEQVMANAPKKADKDAGRDELLRILEEQMQSKKMLTAQIKGCQSAADFIYNNYLELSALLEAIKEIRKSVPPKERKQEVLKLKRAEAYDDATGKVTLKV